MTHIGIVLAMTLNLNVEPEGFKDELRLCASSFIGRSSPKVCIQLIRRVFAMIPSHLPNECKRGSARPCGSCIGNCRPGVQMCVVDYEDKNKRLVWGPCLGAIEPESEVCDGLDNDCNGLVDDGGIICFPPLKEKYWYLTTKLHYRDIPLPMSEIAKISLDIYMN